ncbi:uncharacterized protein LOC6727620 [Drosophila simulans]|uniref:uncharacterized protein LOC6727620 n=1 Tax=Drosophila simulans TaxID=7240 RepID=UPI00078ADE2C|nr:uncharacterized protein LOC6727620 [Drosophila simulans]KMZ02900.1 uncharacterized protein Dsimw501_GD19201 [Drosophila simulans]
MPSPRNDDENSNELGGGSDSERENEDLAMLKIVLRKLNVNDQTLLHRHVSHIPDALHMLWRLQHPRLNFELMQRKLHGSDLELFLQEMITDIPSIKFRSENLQDELNILERANIGRLLHVKCCIITWEKSPSKQNTKFPHWPFLALPKLMSNLTDLDVYCPVQDCFIDQFGKLEALKIAEEISQPAMEAIYLSGAPLKCLNLSGSYTYPMCCISYCNQLSNLFVNLDTFLAGQNEILQLPKLTELKITEIRENKDTTKALANVVQTKGNELVGIQINCIFEDHVKCLSELALNRCMNLTELQLSNCIFAYQDMAKLCLPTAITFARFSSCPDLTDEQLLDFIKANAQMEELLLDQCPELTEDLLHGVLKVRSSGIKQVHLLLRIAKSPNLWDTYQQNLKYWTRKQSILKMESLESSVSEDIVMHFDLAKENENL